MSWPVADADRLGDDGAGHRRGRHKQERVYRAVRERILGGAYGPGYRVVIDALASEFSVSAPSGQGGDQVGSRQRGSSFDPTQARRSAPADPGLFDEEMTVLAVLEGCHGAAAEHSASPRSSVSVATDQMVEAIERLTR